jgi:hypothetical protein
MNHVLKIVMVLIAVTNLIISIHHSNETQFPKPTQNVW